MRKLTLLLGLLLTLGNLYAQEKGQFMLQAEANAGILFCYPYQGTFNSIDLFGSIWELASEPTIAFMSVSNTCLFLPMRNIVSAQERRGHTPKFVPDMPFA